MKVSIQSIACFLALADGALAFQPGLPTNDNMHRKSPSNNIPRTAETRRSQVLTAVNDDTSQPTGQDIDGLRRRQLLFSMLYGSATVMTSPANAAENESDMGTDILLANNNDDDQLSEFTTSQILKPPKDDRDYLAYTLDNGLRVLLCSDPSSNEAAACMDVHVGACSDPPEVPGMAHFAGT